VTGPETNESRPTVTAVVCTRDRGAELNATLRSILANDHENFELIVIDQSSDDRTRDAVTPFLRDRRVRYERSNAYGLGRARNTGLDLACADVIVYTDDDVTVPVDWLTEMAAVFAARADVAVAFCNVAAGPHDETAGFVPAYERRGELEISAVWRKNAARGIGAGLAVRRSMIEELGRFDPLLGAGAHFSSCEDGDIALRALLAGRHVFETDAVSVVHHGFRTWEEGRALTRRDWYGIGAAYAKPIRAGRVTALSIVAYEGIWRAFLVPASRILRGRRPQGLKRGLYFWSGFAKGLRTPLDRATLVFRDVTGGRRDG
jgi:glycosyltransferase involved in cell wall biosynthesis